MCSRNVFEQTRGYLHSCIPNGNKTVPVSYFGARGNFGDVYFERPVIIFCGLILAALFAFATMYALRSGAKSTVMIMLILLVVMLLALTFLANLNGNEMMTNVKMSQDAVDEEIKVVSVL
jgi:uncharacterized membrane protein